MGDEHQTEAACLLEQGASYRRRIGLKPIVATEDPIFAGFKHGAFSVYFGDAPIYHFDLDGRWQRAFLDGTHYLKGLDADVHAIARVREGANLVLKRKALAEVEADELDERVRSTALELIAGLDSGRLGRVEPVSPKATPLANQELREFLERISSWDVIAWRAHRERYQVELSSGIFLPPECQNAVVLQAAHGYATAEGFARHASAVAEMWGRRLLQSRVIFLAGDDVFHRPMSEVATFFTSTIGQTFPIEPRSRGGTKHEADSSEKPRFDGVHAFLDEFAMARPDGDGWRQLAERGLVRISLGVVSGDVDVRRSYQKKWADEDLRTAVREIKTAGLGASVLTLVGAGGSERAEPHLGQTVRLIESLALGAGDFVFLLDEKEISEHHSVAHGITCLDGPTWLDQQAKLKEGLASLKKRGVKVLPYTLEKQWT